MPRRNSKRSLGATHKSPGFTTRTAPTNSSTLHKRTGSSFTPILCHTLQEDGVTRCSQGVKTKGLCHVHYVQYNLSLKSYKAAQERAQEIRNGKEMPSDREIAGYTDGRAAVAELEWVTDYLQAIGEEKAGRESHSKRFYLKVNAGHKKRIDILTRRMRTANSVKRKLRDCILKLSVEGHPVTESEPPYHAVDQIIVTNNVPSLPIQEKFQHSVSGVFTAVDGAQSNDRGGDPYGISHRAHSLLQGRASQGRTLGLPESAEERFVAACHSYDELINVLSAGVFGKSRPPNSHRFLQKPELEAVALASRDHLSLCGVVIADLAWGSSPPSLLTSDTVRTSSPPIRTGNVVWEQVEARSYLFGAVRYEEDVFVEAFLEELRKRPDLFQLLLWSETEPDAPLEETGP
ncbi:hypothetical protein NMY22_g16232 [Coprinellus aureogranulatus]|nr:hypothetical protein NMY22_g16232 [Coprinellus aureogranulatus]